MDNTYILTPSGDFIRADELRHYGIKGMKWGVRRYQNPDGSLTAKGKERYHNTKSGMSMYASMLKPGLIYPDQYQEDSFHEVYATANDRGGYDWKTPLDDEIRASRVNQGYLDDPDSVFEKHMAKINTTNGDEVGTTNNCTKVVADMIVARTTGLDYDCGRSWSGDGRAFEYWFKGAKRIMHDDLQEAIDKKFNKTACDTFGTVDLRNKNGGGHVFVWERNSKGQFSLYEAQSKSGKKYSEVTPSKCFQSYLNDHPWFSTSSTVRIYDCTRAKPNYEHLDEDSVLRITDDDNARSFLRDRHNNRLYSDL